MYQLKALNKVLVKGFSDLYNYNIIKDLLHII